MDKSLIATKSTKINATPSKVWDVLTNPEKIKLFLFGTETTTDWEIDSPIDFIGEYNGQQYHDKGVVLENQPNELLSYSYWTNFSGLEDLPENYSFVSYRIQQLDDNTCEFQWYQQGFTSEEGKCHTENGLEQMLKTIKELAEKE